MKIENLKLNIGKERYLGIILSLLLFSCENDIKVIRALGEKKVGVEEGRDINSYLSKSGKVSAHLTSPIMLRYQADTPRVEFPKTLFVTFYNDSTTKAESTLFAKYGRYNENEKLILLRDSVIVINITGDTLSTEELWWDQNKEKLYTAKPVLIRQISGHLYGAAGMEANQDFSLWTLFKASGELPVADSTLPQ